ncbi:MAG: DUF507 family protein [Nitrospinae bacterium]|nr:DUF507 family protein [Nitrospinota bacterium]
MKISREKINHISSLIVKDFKKREEIDYKTDLNEIRLTIARVMTEELTIEDDADMAVRKTLESYSRLIREGTQEWDVLYQKHLDEYMQRHGL